MKYKTKNIELYRITCKNYKEAYEIYLKKKKELGEESVRVDKMVVSKGDFILTF